jgi:hypothetical protein
MTPTKVATNNDASANGAPYLLPAVLWSQIFCYLGNTQDLIHCEWICRELYQVIHNNDDAFFWQKCPGANDDYDPRYQAMSHRQRACIHCVADLIRKEQKATDNIIESCLGIPLWLAVVHSALNRTLRNLITVHVRGDASFVLMEMLQASLIERLRQAYGTTIKQKNSSDERLDYPILTADALIAKEDPDHRDPDFDHTYYSDSYSLHETFLENIMSPSTPKTNLLLPTPRTKELAASIMQEFPELTMTGIEKMVRRISWRAGVVKMSPDFYRLAWESALQTIMVILVPAYHRTVLFQELRGDLNQVCNLLRFRPPASPLSVASRPLGLICRRRAQQKMSLLPCESMRDVPPFPYFPKRTKAFRLRGHHVLVPRQLEEAAMNVPTVPKRVYGAGWHVGRGSALEQETKRAEDMYSLEEEEVVNGFEWDTEGNDGLANAAHYLDDLGDDDEDEDAEWDKSDGSDDSYVDEDSDEDVEGNNDGTDSDVDDVNLAEAGNDDHDLATANDITKVNDDMESGASSLFIFSTSVNKGNRWEYHSPPRFDVW